jgi:hypothetical protein
MYLTVAMSPSLPILLESLFANRFQNAFKSWELPWTITISAFVVDSSA